MYTQLPINYQLTGCWISGSEIYETYLSLSTLTQFLHVTLDPTGKCYNSFCRVEAKVHGFTS